MERFSRSASARSRSAFWEAITDAETRRKCNFGSRVADVRLTPALASEMPAVGRTLW